MDLTLRGVLARLDLTVVLVVGLLVSNLLVGALAWYTSLHQPIEVTPFFGGATYQKNAFSADQTYLSMMTENFIYSRLNVTPETVRAHHKHLLSFAESQYYPQFLETLNKEARLVSTKKIASYFEIQDIQFDDKNLGCTVIGKLKQATTSHAAHEEPAQYHLTYQYHLGRLLITQFNRLVPDTLEKQPQKKRKKKNQ